MDRPSPVPACHAGAILVDAVETFEMWGWSPWDAGSIVLEGDHDIVTLCATVDGDQHLVGGAIAQGVLKQVAKT